MLRNLAFIVGYAGALAFSTFPSVAETQFATEEEAKTLLERAVVAQKEDKAKAFAMFATGDGGFKDKDLYVWCANASDGILTVHPDEQGQGSARHQGQARRSVR
jgi:hypothetical protein